MNSKKSDTSPRTGSKAFWVLAAVCTVILFLDVKANGLSHGAFDILFLIAGFALAAWGLMGKPVGSQQQQQMR